ncbi:MAG: Phenylacetic acid catabolic protein, partial [Gemmatimonadota bacterium]
NEIVENWLDFYTYTQFIDRDGKFQLKMLSTSSFQPLACSMGPMLKEESFHLGTGNNGLLRIVKAGRIPPEVIQRYFNKWVPTAFDLFGTDNSSSAHWAYVWGLKGRFDERENKDPADVAHLNEASRELYRQEITRLIARLNLAIPEREQHLNVPDIRFNRKIGLYARQSFTTEGVEIDASAYPAYLATAVPTTEDRELLRNIFKDNDWIESKKAEDDN